MIFQDRKSNCIYTETQYNNNDKKIFDTTGFILLFYKRIILCSFLGKIVNRCILVQRWWVISHIYGVFISCEKLLCTVCDAEEKKTIIEGG